MSLSSARNLSGIGWVYRPRKMRMKSSFLVSEIDIFVPSVVTSTSSRWTTSRGRQRFTIRPTRIEPVS